MNRYGGALPVRYDTLRRSAFGCVLLLLCACADADGLRVVVLSDFNGSYGSTTYEASVRSAVAAARRLQPDLVLSTGDMVAGQRRHPPFTRPQLEAMWRAFHATVSDPLAAAGLEFVATAGNHDASAYATFDLERTVYREQWRGRAPARLVDRGDFPFYFAFAAGDALVVSLDATVPGHLPATQRDWLARLLAEHGPRYRWRIVFGHLPIWPLVAERQRDILGDRELEQMLVAADVTVYLSGHHHAYFPGTHGGLAQIGQACVGAAPRHLIGTQRRSARAVTVLEFAADGGWTVRALTGKDYATEIDPESLPDSIDSRIAQIRRLESPIMRPAAAGVASESQ